MTTMIVRLAGRSLAMGRTSLVPQLCALGARRYGVNGPQGVFTESELSVFDPDVIFTHAEENQLGTTPETKKMVNRLRDSLKEPSWKEHLDQEFDKVYFEKLADFLKSEQAMNYKVFPSYDLVFNAFNLTPLPETKVVIIGNDPYHNPGQSHGLSYSVATTPRGGPLPPSIENIFRELRTDVGVRPRSGSLEAWASRGVLLLNNVLTVRERSPGSHSKQGWETFTDEALRIINREREHVVFLLWGRNAAERRTLIDEKKHKVLTATHPSPYAAERGFFGCKHFSKTNAYREQFGLPPIDWHL